ncbi:uncharacterized protein with SCP/PR1 domains [Desulfitobacterium dehalogenans ATCC 51507]|uniref:Uncharacterized protein with SCP/PR1 domains n=2 Tax=Desulfitobacterium dehalogenans TaxID=36854 RepID=I4A5A5_DESDJ|nr:CAP domain-containing protein [Desulfitobacterium dehalogenans]AFL99139.1 uncharacterized protein with SCP/PR1 domains [Desulfitobacterium dehalogenans ATCC 51507]
MKKAKKLAIGVSLVVLLAVAGAPVQAALKVSNSYSSSGSNGSIISLRSCMPWTNNTRPTTPSTPSAPSYNDSNGSTQNGSTPVNTNPMNTPKAEKPSNPTPPPTQPAQTKPAPTQPAPTKPATQPTTPPTSATTTVSTQEQLMINGINKERADAGLAPMKVDLLLVDVARLKAQDMKTNGYFSHTSPTYGSPFDMLRNAGIQYRSAGENIARNMSVDAAMAAFMSSDGHRKNILNPAYTHVGVGVVSSSSGNYYVQIFAQL